MSMFCDEFGCGKNPLCCNRMYYQAQYRVDNRGMQIPLTLTQLLNIDTVIVGNLVFTSNGMGNTVVIPMGDAVIARKRGLFG